jgi:hypothetical protein
MKTIKILFIIIFLSMISLPLVFIDRESSISEKENRTLAAFPNRDINIKNIPRALDDYIDDRFGFREVFVTMMENIESSSRKIIDNTVIGKNNWFFFAGDNSVGDFFKINLLSDEQVTRIVNAIERRAKWCNDNGIKFIFLIVPEKHNVYPEFFPFDRPEGITRMDQVISALPDNLRDMVIYPVDIFIKNKNGEIPLYLETDSHWNSKGAYYTHLEMVDRIKRMFPETGFPDIDYVTEVSYEPGGGDLILSLRGVSAIMTIPDVRPADGWDKYYSSLKGSGNNPYGTATNYDSSLLKAVVFHDSYYNWLYQFTSTVFSSTDFFWNYREFSFPVDKEYILENKPDIIIWELVERYIERLLYSE